MPATAKSIGKPASAAIGNVRRYAIGETGTKTVYAQLAIWLEEGESTAAKMTTNQIITRSSKGDAKQ